MTDNQKLIAIVGIIAVAYFFTRKGHILTTPNNELSNKEVDTIVNTNLRRGERLNNPLNIEKSANKWLGLATDQSKDSRFATFISPEYGIRAWVRLMHTYINKHGLNTITKIINRYAPSVENDTNSYINSVAKNSGIGANQVIKFEVLTLMALVRAMIIHEQGRNIYPESVITKGVALGFN